MHGFHGCGIFGGGAVGVGVRLRASQMSRHGVWIIVCWNQLSLKRLGTYLEPGLSVGQTLS